MTQGNEIEPTEEVRGEAYAWAMEWAKRLYDEAPPETEGETEHIRHQTRRLHEAVATFPVHLRGYGLRPGVILMNAMVDHGAERRRTTA